jgi:hypothetical protein
VTPTPTPPATSTSAAALPTSTTTTASTEPTSAEAGGLGTWGWILLIALLAAAAGLGAWLFTRSRRRSAWDAEADALVADTRRITGSQLPAVLTADDPGQRALSWPPLRAALIDLVRRWDLLVQQAAEGPRRDQSLQIRAGLQDLVASLDAENQAMATGRDWRLLRPRVEEAQRALSAALTGPRADPYAGAGVGPNTPY